MSIKRINQYKTAPVMMKAMMDLEKTTHESILPLSLRELVKIRASQLNNCAFCLNMHTKDALKAGEEINRLMAISVWKESSFFTDRERAALLWTETLTLLSEKEASDEIYQKVSDQFNDQELAELTVMIAVINAWNRFGVGLAMKAE
ncbi:carboxymuconolactone decarboxylase family protein [Commensalibacter papalotli (ex Botero et al. 2024)]|uniref:Contains CxxC motif (YciW) (PDB:1GU9) n=1 Tax=Commensalibacter papalotli (ex Botero et al. 2024) TaxID=2972766 RepID=A0ABM9HRS6_9PROT|nr:carboxymuconolactone decarboxylase family protein [Commensalibacter papalotli (ex Botero et al. 2024)]CAI3942034.1 Alkylhydroperoxidase family enzyme [Commensalibacter papalotli (ex Botero et al. 2024)]CAI3948927.1 Alkylhydroperoxidase family enzyme [Commensalibacter papalotli (ex Botero et al. 2024)]